MTDYDGYGPGREGFELVAELALTDESYSWEIVDVHRELSNGKLWAYYGTGCSCYGPHDEETFPTDYAEVLQLADAMSLVPHVDNPHEPPTLSARLDFSRKVMDALKAQPKGADDVN